MPFINRELKKKTLWKSFTVPFDGLIQPEGLRAIDTRQVPVKNHLLAGLR